MTKNFSSGWRQSSFFSGKSQQWIVLTSQRVVWLSDDESTPVISSFVLTGAPSVGVNFLIAYHISQQCECIAAAAAEWWKVIFYKTNLWSSAVLFDCEKQRNIQDKLSTLSEFLRLVLIQIDFWLLSNWLIKNKESKLSCPCEMFIQHTANFFSVCFLP